ncbi:MAG: efflux RND transporter periplasmic adaptor subunit [Candidatus Competibacteraceae bacterium]|nr:efflux RND transporter periplasmic adaptor subunit [Candidatus Competibacteraceae bacterium]
MLHGVVAPFRPVFTRFLYASMLLFSPLLAAQIPVSTSPLSELIYQPQREAPAQVIALEDSRISAEISAVITALIVDVGATVAQDDVLAELDCSDYDLQAQELSTQQQGTQARLQFAESQLKRARSLQKQRTVSEELVDQRQSERDALRAELARLAAGLARVDRSRQRCKLRAPFAGTVLERLVSKGEYVTPGTPMFRLLADTELEVAAQIPSTDLQDLTQAQQLWLRTPVDNYPLQLRAVLPFVDSAVQTQTVRLRFSAATAPAGSAGRLVWRLGPHLPANLLLQRDKQLGLFLAINGRATFQPLPAAKEGRPAAIRLRGTTPPANNPAESANIPLLAPTSLVITEGAQSLRDGDLIRLQP